MESILPYCSSVISNEYSIYTALFLGGLISGFTHCAGMCGPFVVMQASSNMASDNSTKFGEFTRLKNSALLPYHLGRITTYTILAVIAAYLSAHILAFDGMKWFSGIMLAISGFIFLTYSVSGSKKIFGFNLTIPEAIQKKASSFFQNPKGFNGYVLGFILGLIPCGMIISAIFAVSSTGNVLTAATAMLFFGLGTVPGLFSISYGSNFLFSKVNFKIFNKLAIFISGLVLVTTSVEILF